MLKGEAENIKWGRPPQPPYFIVKCYQGIVCRRVHYSGLTVRGTGPEITASRLPEEAPLLANGHDNT
jgi:hypothetical protein